MPIDETLRRALGMRVVPLSTAMHRTLELLREYYPEASIQLVLERAEAIVQERGGRYITQADWNKAQDELAQVPD